jgi:hypothetical protein
MVDEHWSWDAFAITYNWCKLQKKSERSKKFSPGFIPLILNGIGVLWQLDVLMNISLVIWLNI